MRQLFMETGLNPVQAGGTSAGWVSGNPVGAAPGLLSGGIVFDLGPDWAEYQRLQVNMYLPGGGSASMVYQPSGSDSTGYNGTRRLIFALSATDVAGVSITVTSSNSKIFTLIPQGRFVTALLNNTDATLNIPVGAKITLQAFQY